MVRRVLRVWEDASLHGLPGQSSSIVEWDPDEYDNVYVDEVNDLVINKATIDKFDESRMVWLIVARIKAGLWKKFQLDEVPEPEKLPVDEFKNVGSWGASGSGGAVPYDEVKTDFDLTSGDIGTFARSTDPFPTAPQEPATVTRADTGAHTVSDDDRQPGEPYVTEYDPEKVTVIDKAMREKVLERLGEHVEKIGHKNESPSATDTTILGLDASMALPEAGDRDVFSN